MMWWWFKGLRLTAGRRPSNDVWRMVWEDWAEILSANPGRAMLRTEAGIMRSACLCGSSLGLCETQVVPMLGQVGPMLGQTTKASPCSCLWGWAWWCWADADSWKVEGCGWKLYWELELERVCLCVCVCVCVCASVSVCDRGRGSVLCWTSSSGMQMRSFLAQRGEMQQLFPANNVIVHSRPWKLKANGRMCWWRAWRLLFRARRRSWVQLRLPRWRPSGWTCVGEVMQVWMLGVVLWRRCSFSEEFAVGCRVLAGLKASPSSLRKSCTWIPSMCWWTSVLMVGWRRTFLVKCVVWAPCVIVRCKTFQSFPLDWSMWVGVRSRWLSSVTMPRVWRCRPGLLG